MNAKAFYRPIPTNAMASLLHELWEEENGEGYTFCLAGPMGDGARKMLAGDAKLIWKIEADSHVQAMFKP
jgi:hypothetical protein